MAPPEQGSGAPAAVPAAALRRQMSCTCTCGREEPMKHERRPSSFYSFSSPAASPSPSTASSSASYYLPASNKSSCESIPSVITELGNQPSFSSTSSYESFFHIEAADLATAGGSPTAAAPDHDDCSRFLDFKPVTRAPAVQTMVEQGQHKAEGGAAAFDAKRLPSSMFRTRSTSPAEWSVTSNDSLFSIQLSHSGDLSALYTDLYFDAAGFPRFPSAGHEASLKLPSVSEGSGGLCVREDCARCSGSGNVRKSVRFAATESVSGEGKHSIVISTLAVAMEEAEAPASATKTPAAGWCELGCCWPSTPTMWWPRCCSCHGCGCQCKWWL